jgi:hypothetical protein
MSDEMPTIGPPESRRLLRITTSVEPGASIGWNPDYPQSKPQRRPRHSVLRRASVCVRVRAYGTFRKSPLRERHYRGDCSVCTEATELIGMWHDQSTRPTR